MLSAEVEAATLARIGHLNLLVHTSMTEAIAGCPWMEVALHRLFAIVYVENVTSCGGGDPRAAAWQLVERILEIQPSANIRVLTLDSMLAREASTSVKAMDAFIALGKRGTVERRTLTPDPR